MPSAPAATAARLVELKKKGVSVYFIDSLPEDVPGLSGLKERRQEFKKARKSFGKAQSLESVFAALGGWLISGNTLTGREFAGCALVLAAIIVAQLPEMIASKRNKALSD